MRLVATKFFERDRPIGEHGIAEELGEAVIGDFLDFGGDERERLADFHEQAVEFCLAGERGGIGAITGGAERGVLVELIDKLVD